MLSFINRGSKTIVGTAFDRPLTEAECKFCLACVEVCPTGALIDRDLSFKNWSDRKASLIPCKYSCPAEIDVPRYIYLVTIGKYREATAVIREKVPFPGILGRICTHPCEVECRREKLNESIDIKNIKRFAADHDDGFWKLNQQISPPTGKKVAIVGSGPAGLTVAYFLVRLGYSVTVFEKLPQPGGMMFVGIVHIAQSSTKYCPSNGWDTRCVARAIQITPIFHANGTSTNPMKLFRTKHIPVWVKSHPINRYKL